MEITFNIKNIQTEGVRNCEKWNYMGGVVLEQFWLNCSYFKKKSLLFFDSTYYCFIVLKKFSGNDRHFQIKNALTHAHKKGDLAKQNGNLVPAKLSI